MMNVSVTSLDDFIEISGFEIHLKIWTCKNVDVKISQNMFDTKELNTN